MQEQAQDQQEQQPDQQKQSNHYLRNTQSLVQDLSQHDENGGTNEFSLYARIGGGRVIAEVVDAFYDRILADPVMQPFFTNIIIDSESRQLNKGRLERFLGDATGGPVNYKGRDMREAHRNMNIQSLHFDKFVDYFTAALRERAVSSDLVEETRRLLYSMRPDVVQSLDQEDDASLIV